MSSELRPDDEFVLRIARERGVRFVRLWFVDVLGILKSDVRLLLGRTVRQCVCFPYVRFLSVFLRRSGPQ